MTDDTTQSFLTDEMRDDEDSTRTERCRAVTASGDRCENPVSRMTDSPYCSAHDRADDVQEVSEDA